MRTYKNKKDGFKEFQKKALMRSILVMGLALIFGLVISYRTNDIGQINTLPFVILIGIGAGGLGIFKGLNRQKQLFESYLLTVDDDFIQRDQLNTPTVKINKSDVKEIIAGQNGSLTIKGQNKTDLIVVTNQIDDFADLEKYLLEIKEFSRPTEKSTIEKLSLPFVFLTLALMAIVYISTNKYFVLVSGAILTMFLTWSFYEIQTSKNVDSKTKKNSWWTILVILSVIGITYSKVKG